MPGPIFLLQKVLTCMTFKRQGPISGAQLVGKHVVLDLSGKADGPNSFLCNFSTPNDKQTPLSFKERFLECSVQAKAYRLQNHKD